MTTAPPLPACVMIMSSQIFSLFSELISSFDKLGYVSLFVMLFNRSFSIAVMKICTVWCGLGGTQMDFVDGLDMGRFVFSIGPKCACNNILHVKTFVFFKVSCDYFPWIWYEI